MGRPRGHYNRNVREYRGKNGGLVLGNGCKYYADCLNCPFDDCKAALTDFITSNAKGCIDNLGTHRKIGEARPIVSFHSEDQFQGALDRIDRLYGGGVCL